MVFHASHAIGFYKGGTYIYENLRIDPEGNVIPCLSTRWECSQAEARGYLGWSFLPRLFAYITLDLGRSMLV